MVSRRKYEQENAVFPVGCAVWGVRRAGLHSRLFPAGGPRFANRADGAERGLLRAPLPAGLPSRAGTRPADAEAAAGSGGAVFGADFGAAGHQYALRPGRRRGGGISPRPADPGFHPHGLQRLLGAEPVPVGVPAVLEHESAEKDNLNRENHEMI